MPTALPPLLSLRVFEAAARHLSFKQAAHELHVTPAAVSHQIKALEDFLGQPLFLRRTRALELTEAGRAMLPKLQQGLELFAEAVASARQPQSTTRLRLVVPPSFATRWLVHRLQGFNDRHPEIELSLSTAMSAVDSTADETRETDLAALASGEVDLQVRFGHGNYPGMFSERVMPVSYVAVCHPALPGGEKPLEKPEDLRHHVLIHDETHRDRSEPASWREWLRVAGVEGVDASRGPHFSNSGLALEAAADRMGVAISIEQLLDRDLADRRLMLLFDRRVASRSAYHLVCRQRDAERPEILAFRHWLASEAATAAAA